MKEFITLKNALAYQSTDEKLIFLCDLTDYRVDDIRLQIVEDSLVQLLDKNLMTTEEYHKEIIEKFPDCNYTHVINHLSKPELLKDVAINLFLIGDIDSNLALETRIQLNYLQEHDYLI